jgi:pimeloyl-ACP methyl ester carboxylesterase
MTVDLRGHGQSTKQLSPTGEQIELDPSRFTKEHFLAMAALDMEQVRSFLVGKNDAGDLNLNKLCIVGAGMGATVGINWAALDWSAPPLAIGKQGQDVKGLVLISPRWSYRGATIQNAMKLRPLKQNVAWMLVYGDPTLRNSGNSGRGGSSEDAKVRADAKRLFNQLERFHPESKDEKQPRDLETLAWPSSLQGTTLLSQVGEPIETEIVSFLTEHVARENQPWMPRRKRLP